MAIKKQTIVVTGANGQLGSCLRELSPTVPHKFIFTDVEDLDITSREAVSQMMERENPDWVVNCAAYTAVDKAESDGEFARQLNTVAVGILAEESARINAGMVQISTDYVFKGDEPSPRTEEDATEPQSVYGTTKLEGEVEALKNPRSIIIRTSWLYSIYGSNFVKTMLRLGGQKSEIDVVCDQWGSPTSAHDLAKAIIVAVENPHSGIYHFSNQGATNWALFAEEIFSITGSGCVVNHITSDGYPTAAKRPEYSLMNSSKFTKTFGVAIPEWEHSLEEVIAKL